MLFPTFRSKDHSWDTHLKIYGRSHISIFSPVSILIQCVPQGSVVRSRFGAHSRLSGMKIFGCHGIKSGLALFRTTRPRLLLFLRRCHMIRTFFSSSQRVLYAYQRNQVDEDGEPEPIPIPGSFNGRIPQIVELVTVGSVYL